MKKFLNINRSGTEQSQGDEGENDEADEGELHPLVTITKIDPNEIPEVIWI